MKQDPTPLPRQPNPELLKHEKLREIEAILYKKQKQLKNENKFSEDEIKELINKERLIL